MDFQDVLFIWYLLNFFKQILTFLNFGFRMDSNYNKIELKQFSTDRKKYFAPVNSYFVKFLGKSSNMPQVPALSI